MRPDVHQLRREDDSPADGESLRRAVDNGSWAEWGSDPETPVET